LSDHLSSAILNALADGELSADQLVRVDEHLAACSQCTSDALAQSLLKSATARAGQRYTAPPELRTRLLRQAAQETSHPQPSSSGQARLVPNAGYFSWAAAVAVLLVCISLFVAQYYRQQSSFESASLVTEACDQHIATLAANSPPEVISSDRHTVKPWFQGKLPFSFNLPENLPGDTTLDGANLTYLRDQPTAQLLYSIGKHRVSVFVQQRTDATAANGPVANHSGFHLTGFRAPDLEVLAISDVDPVRLSDLADRIRQAQTGQGQPK
jgi:anti-sigma factor RsiW